ncbi:alpha/beta hydrolase [Pseudotenacibaculum sp. MALMAid0570]|uniref:alpha/beta hydrolase family protein n=1 Tax=Pseudotenacibaculum sp. MALMAid0570 TaxID=3143938 RepID=UPI0032DEF2C5
MNPSLTIPKLVSVTARFIEFFSSTIISKIAVRLFLTPINFKMPEREKYMLKSAQKKRLQIPTIKKEVDILSYGYSKKKVLLVHGWAGRSTQLFAFADRLLEKGYMVISFDGPAHGKSTGKTTSMLEFLEVIKVIVKTYGPFEAAIGHSLGGMSLYNATSDFLEIKTFVSIGSGDKITDIIKNFANNLTLHPWSAKKIQKNLEKKWSRKADDYASHHLAKKITIPVLIVHDTKDGDVPVSCAYNIRQNLKNGSLLISHGLGHTKILRDKEIVHKSVEFIIKNT